MKKIYKYGVLLLATLSVTVSNAGGNLVPVKFKMDWVVEGTMAPFALPVDKGYYKAEGLDVTWVDTSIPMRETMLVRGEVDAITGYASTVIEGLERRGIRRKNLVVMPYVEHGIDWYSNVIIANAEFIKKHPEAVRKFLQGLIKGLRETIPDTRGAVAKYVKPRDIDISVRGQEHVLLINFESMFVDDNRTSFGAMDMERLNKMTREASRLFRLKQPININQLWNGSFLPVNRTINYKQ